MRRPRDDVRSSSARPGAGVVRRGLAVLAVSGLAALGACATEGDDGVVADDPDVGEVGDGIEGPAQDDPIGFEDPTLDDDDVELGDGGDPLTADLEITAGVADDSDARGQALLECGPDGAAGALWLEGAAAEEACEALEDPSVVAALDPPDEDQVCTEQYGGPDVATIVGTVEGIQVDAVVDRRDGCAIDRWDALDALLPDPAST